MRLDSLRTLYEHELRDLQDAESQLIELLPRMADAATDKELQEHFRKHGELAREHRDRLGGILQTIDSDHEDVRCEGIEGISREAERLLDESGSNDAVKDAALLAIAQKFEHYEMAGYGTIRTYADILGDDEAQKKLQKTLDEESKSDDRLTRIALKSVNPAAKA